MQFLDEDLLQQGFALLNEADVEQFKQLLERRIKEFIPTDFIEIQPTFRWELPSYKITIIYDRLLTDTIKSFLKFRANDVQGHYLKQAWGEIQGSYKKGEFDLNHYTHRPYFGKDCIKYINRNIHREIKAHVTDKHPKETKLYHHVELLIKPSASFILPNLQDCIF